MRKPLCIDLYAGLGGWTEGFLAEGYTVVGFDNERHIYGAHRYPGHLVIQDVRTLHGAQFKAAAVIVASPPCQEYSYMAMPWSRAKEKARQYREHPETQAQLTALFDACFRIQREASAAAGHHIPMIVENVRGAIPWVGRSAWNFGSYHLWGDVPALMPITMRRATPGYVGKALNHEAERATKNNGGSWFNIGSPGQTVTNQNPVSGPRGGQLRHDPCYPHLDPNHPSYHAASDGVKQASISGMRDNGKGDRWFQDGAARSGSKSSARKAASARIAKIPYRLSLHIAQTFKPRVA